MSGFQLPPLLGFDRSARDRFPVAGLQDPERITRRPGGEDQAGPGAAESGGFSGMLASALESVQELQAEARAKTKALALGEDVEVHDVLLAAEKSEVAMNLMLEVRNKLVDAWEKLSRSAV